ncbi:MAG: cytochrome-c oxidase, cbb3-type subunit III [Gammaproteobacteria bacterium]|nr:cytochrome-c oxidase, cbb3-type subunit III [Gammaproteobacteria bacterium]
MTDAWSWYVIALVVINVVAIIWLLIATHWGQGDEVTQGSRHSWDGIEELNNPMPRWWLWLFVITIVYSIVYLIVYPGLGNFKGTKGWTQQSQFEQQMAEARERQREVYQQFAGLSAQQLAVNVRAMETAQRLYLNNCATCHGSTGQGAKGFPNLTDTDWLYGGLAEDIATSITRGRAGIMPAAGLPDSGVAILARYVKGLSGGEMTPLVAEKGKALFATCAACHGSDGQGNQQFGAPNLTDDIWLHGSHLRDIESIIRHGKQGNMPGFRDNLTAAQIDLLTAWVLRLGQP